MMLASGNLTFTVRVHWTAVCSSDVMLVGKIGSDQKKRGFLDAALAYIYAPRVRKSLHIEVQKGYLLPEDALGIF